MHTHGKPFSWFHKPHKLISMSKGQTDLFPVIPNRKYQWKAQPSSLRYLKRQTCGFWSGATHTFLFTNKKIKLNNFITRFFYSICKKTKSPDFYSLIKNRTMFFHKKNKFNIDLVRERKVPQCLRLWGCFVAHNLINFRHSTSHN